VAEFIGTFILVAGGCAAAAVDYRMDGILGGHIGVAVAWGLVVAMVIFAIGHLSGAHINPAVTLAFASGRHFPWTEVLPYWVAQVAGAITGALTVAGLFGTGSGLSVTQPFEVSDVGAIGIEILITAILMLVVMAVATDTRAQGALAAVAIGVTVTVIGLIMGPMEGASMNPARSIGPAVATGEYTALWVYLIGPIIGAMVGVAIYAYMRGRPHPEGSRPDAEAGEDLS
jgi:MIP family channel proteins